MNEIEMSIAELLSSDLLNIEIFNENGTSIRIFWHRLKVNLYQKNLEVICIEYTKTPKNESMQPWIMAADNNSRVPVYDASQQPIMVEVPTDEIVGYEDKTIEISAMDGRDTQTTVQVPDITKPIFGTKLEQKTIGEYDMWKFYIMNNHLVSLDEAVTSGINRRAGLAYLPLAFIEHN